MLAHYKASPTLARFHQSEGFFRCVVGAIASGKTTAAIMECFRRAVAQEPNADGVRPTRFAVVRNTAASLKQTTLPDILAYLGPLAVHRVADGMVRFDFVLADGTRVRSDWLLVPLEEAKDVRRLLSLQLTGIFFEELRVLDMKIITDALGRVGRYPSMALAGVEPTWNGALAVTNPWPNGSPHHQVWEVERPKGWELFRQPSGLSAEAENVEHHVAGYYDRLMEGATDEWIKVNIMGENGQDRSGQAVFATFSYDMHVRSRGIRVMPGRQLLIGLDTDRHAAACIGQQDPNGVAAVLAECWGDGIGLELFWMNELRPLLADKFPSCSVVAIIDPSAARRSSITEESQLQALQRMGLAAVLAPTNSIEARLRAVDELLVRQVGGHGAVQIDGLACPMLVRGLASEYRYARNSKGALAPLPDKTNKPFSDLCFTLDTPVLMGDGRWLPIGDVQEGDMVATPNGVARVLAARTRTVEADGLVQVELATGERVVCTTDHPWVMGDGRLVRADALQYGDILYGTKGTAGWADHERAQELKSAACGGSRTLQGGIGSVTRGNAGDYFSTGGYGNPRMVRFRKAVLSTILTMTATIMNWKILSAWSLPGTLASTPCSEPQTPTTLGVESHHRQGQPQRCGTEAPKEGRGIGRWLSTLLPTKSSKPTPAFTAGRITPSNAGGGKSDTALQAVWGWLGSRVGWTTRPAPAPFVRGVSAQTSIREQKLAPVIAGVRPYRGAGEREVRCLTVEHDGVFVVEGGAVVSNCDSFHYFALGLGGMYRGHKLQVRTPAGYRGRAEKRVSSLAWT